MANSYCYVKVVSTTSKCGYEMIGLHNSLFISHHRAPFSTGTTLVCSKVKWENRLIGDSGEPAKTSVDGTDFRTRELLTEFGEFDKGRFTPKFHGPGLRYEIAISIKQCHIVHINGPFKCGNHPDIQIARSLLHKKLAPGEFYIADSGYQDVHGPAVCICDLKSRSEKRKAMILRAKHETINRRYKEWKILGDIYRHSEHTHGAVFRALTAVIECDIEKGRYRW